MSSAEGEKERGAWEQQVVLTLLVSTSGQSRIINGQRSGNKGLDPFWEAQWPRGHERSWGTETLDSICLTRNLWSVRS
jgi:hypothetical protein